MTFREHGGWARPFRWRDHVKTGRMKRMGDWRGKDDVDLTVDDLGAMLAEGAPVQVVVPYVPGNGFVVQPTPSYAGVSTTTKTGDLGELLRTA